MTREIEYYFEELDLYVYLDCSITTENDGIGSYEYAGIKGFDEGSTYFVVDDITYDRSQFTEDQNLAIEKCIKQNIKDIHKKALENINDYFD